MAVTWKRRFKPDLVLSKIEAARTVSPSGGVSFRGSGVQENVELLTSMLKFPEAAQHLDKVELAWAAVSYEKSSLTKENVAQAIGTQIRQRLSKRLHTYSLLTTLSIDGRLLPPRIELPESTVFTYPGTPPPRLMRAREDLEKQKIDIPRTPPTYAWVRVRVKQNSAEAAARQSLQQLSVLRGVIALVANYEMQISLGGSQSYGALNRVRTGGIHTVHLPTGAKATEIIWYEPKFKPTPLYTRTELTAWRSNLKRILRRILSLNYSDKIILSLIQYADAFDEPDHSNAFLKLWSGLELLTSTSSPVNYDDVIRRCSFMHSTSEFETQVLQHLREHRNALVHRGDAIGDPRIKCYQLQRYFRQAIYFHMGFGRTFKSLDHANEFLDLPSDKDVLKTKIALIKKAVSYLTPKP